MRWCSNGQVASLRATLAAGEQTDLKQAHGLLRSLCGGDDLAAASTLASKLVVAPQLDRKHPYLGASLSVVIQACLEARQVDWALQCFDRCRERGVPLDVPLWNDVVESLCERCLGVSPQEHNPEHARALVEVFSAMLQTRIPVSAELVSEVMRALVVNGHAEDAHLLWDELAALMTPGLEEGEEQEAEDEEEGQQDADAGALALRRPVTPEVLSDVDVLLERAGKRSDEDAELDAELDETIRSAEEIFERLGARTAGEAGEEDEVEVYAKEALLRTLDEPMTKVAADLMGFLQDRLDQGPASSEERVALQQLEKSVQEVLSEDGLLGDDGMRILMALEDHLSEGEESDEDEEESEDEESEWDEPDDEPFSGSGSGGGTSAGISKVTPWPPAPAPSPPVDSKDPPDSKDGTAHRAGGGTAP